MPRNFTNFFESLGLPEADRCSPDQNSGKQDVPSNFRAAEPTPTTRSLRPGLGGADSYYSRKQQKHARNAVVCAELLVFAIVLAVLMAGFGW